MNENKAKAIEALNEIGELYKESYTDSYGHLKFFVKDEKGFQLIKAELAKPTLDDAIAVVQELYSKSNRDVIWQIDLKREFVKDILTALLGLKE